MNDAGAYQQTIELLTDELLEIHASRDFYLQRVYAHACLNQADELKFYLNKVSGDILPGNLYYFLRGLYCSWMQDYNKAIEGCSKVIELNP